jgi:hypothetical protein
MEVESGARVSTVRLARLTQRNSCRGRAASSKGRIPRARSGQVGVHLIVSGFGARTHLEQELQWRQ